MDPNTRDIKHPGGKQCQAGWRRRCFLTSAICRRHASPRVVRRYPGHLPGPFGKSQTPDYGVCASPPFCLTAWAGWRRAHLCYSIFAVGCPYDTCQIRSPDSPLHSEAVRRMLTVGRESKKGIPATKAARHEVTSRSCDPARCPVRFLGIAANCHLLAPGLD